MTHQIEHNFTDWVFLALWLKNVICYVKNTYQQKLKEKQIFLRNLVIFLVKMVNIGQKLFFRSSVTWDKLLIAKVNGRNVLAISAQI